MSSTSGTSALAEVRETKNVPAFSMRDLQVMAQTIVKSGMFGMQNEAQAMSLLLLCQAQGIHPMIAVQKYHIIQGRPAMKSEAMLADFQQAGGKVKWIERSDLAAEAEFSHPAGGSLRIRWTIEQAHKAGLVRKNKDGSPGNWDKFPRAMLSARVVSEGVRAVLPSIVQGVYTPEELQDIGPELDITPTGNAPANTPAPQSNKSIIDVLADELEQANGDAVAIAGIRKRWEENVKSKATVVVYNSGLKAINNALINAGVDPNTGEIIDADFTESETADTKDPDTEQLPLGGALGDYQKRQQEAANPASHDSLKIGDEVPQSYWSLTKEEKDRIKPANARITKEDGKFVVVAR